jgi:hypothetical protein
MNSFKIPLFYSLVYIVFDNILVLLHQHQTADLSAILSLSSLQEKLVKEVPMQLVIFLKFNGLEDS